MAHLIAVVKQKFFDSNGDPLNGGKLYSYQAGTSTPLVTYQDKAESTQNTNPVILDANGEASVWLGANAYKLVLKDSLDNVLWTVDNVTFLNDGAVTTAKLADGILSADTNGRAKMANGFVNTAKIEAGALSADATGLAKMAAGFLQATTDGLAKMADGFLAASAAGRAKMAAGFFSADATGLGKFADGFLTADATGRAKMADGFVTLAKMVAVNKTLSSSCGSYSTSSGTYVAVTNLSSAITTGGRQVKISLQSDASASNISALTGGDSLMQIKRGSTVIAIYTLTNAAVIPSSAIQFTDEPAAGTYTYSVEVAAVGGGSVAVYNAKLLVREL